MNLEHFYNEEFTNSISKLTLKAKRNISNRALFLDRDGVLIEDVHHIDNPNKVLLCENVKEFLNGARLKGYNSIVITNQSSVSRSIITYEEYKSITNRFLSLLTVAVSSKVSLAFKKITSLKVSSHSFSFDFT